MENEQAGFIRAVKDDIANSSIRHMPEAPKPPRVPRTETYQEQTERLKKMAAARASANQAVESVVDTSEAQNISPILDLDREDPWVTNGGHGGNFDSSYPAHQETPATTPDLTPDTTNTPPKPE
jgi:hypothetical protein